MAAFLPPEVLENIFSFVPIPQRFSLTSVCQRWKTTIDECPFFETDHLDLERDFTPWFNREEYKRIMIKALHRKGKVIKIATFSYNMPFDCYDDLILTFAECCSKLKSLNLEHVHLEMTTLIHLVQNCNKIESFSIRLSSFIAEEVWKTIFTDWHLRTLDISLFFTKLNLFNFCPSLKKLSIVHCSDIATLGSAVTLGNALTCTNIEELCLTDLYVEYNGIIRLMQTCCSSLRVLKLDKVYDLTTQDLCSVLQMCYNLVSVFLGNGLIDLHVIQTLQRCCPKIEDLRLKGPRTSDEECMCIAEMPALKYLHLNSYYCSEPVSVEGCLHLLTSSKTLRTLEICTVWSAVPHEMLAKRVLYRLETNNFECDFSKSSWSVIFQRKNV